MRESSLTRQHERIQVIFVHGLFSKPAVWGNFQRLIAEDPEINEFVTTSCFAYNSPKIRLRPDRRIADVDDIAVQLGTHLSTRDGESIVLVTHSQGGLVAQRFLARTLQEGKGQSLSQIRQVVMYACPNNGSQFLLLARRSTGFLTRNPQEHQLRPFEKRLTETQRVIIKSVVHAADNTSTERKIPIAAYGGATDNIVPTHNAYSIFTDYGVVPGDHFSIIQPENHDAESYRVLKKALVAISAAAAPPPEAPVDDRHKVVITPPYNERTKSLHGRRELITSIMTDRRFRVHVIAGLGGLGKSRLALEIANREQHRRQVWWIRPSQINSGMREVALQLGAPVNEIDRALEHTETAADLVWRFLNASPRPWLLVIDNADYPAGLSLPDGEVSNGNGWLRKPANPGGMVIVTSRDRSEQAWGNWCRLHRIPPLDVENGAYVLMDRAGPGAGSNEDARNLSTQLGGLPLALVSAGDYLRGVVTTHVFAGREAIRDFESYRVAVQRRFESADEPAADQDELTWLHTVRSVIDISLDLLDQRGLYQAASLLKLFACLSIAPIPYHVLLSSTAPDESPLFAEFTAARQRDVLKAMDDLGLIEPIQQPEISGELAHVLTLHPVVHRVLRKDDEVQRNRDEYYGLIVRIMLDVTKDADPDEPANWPLWSALAVHSVGICRSGLLGDTRLGDASVIASCLELARLTARYLVAIGLLVPAHELVRALIDNCAGFGFADTDRQLLGIRHELGRINIERGNPRAAEEELAKVITHRTAILGEYKADTLASRHKHARAILDQDRWDEAEPLLRAIVEAEHKVRGAEHKDTLVVRHSLARAVLAQGRAAEAEQMLREIQEVYKNRSPALSSASSEASRVRSTLARALLEQGRPDEAIEETRNALRETPENHPTPGSFWIRWTLALALLSKGEIAESIAELEKLEADQQRVLGPTHPDTVRTTDLLIKAKSIPNGG